LEVVGNLEIARSPEFEQFVRRRRLLNDKLAESGARVDDWINEHERKAPAMIDLAYFQGLLEQRRTLLTDLASLDDSFVTYLLQIQHPARDSDVASA
jgi:hypothetical protein